MRRKRSNFEVELSIYANMTDNSYLTTVGETDLNIVKHQSHDVSCDSTLNIVNHQSHDVSRDSVSLSYSIHILVLGNFIWVVIF